MNSARFIKKDWLWWCRRIGHVVATYNRNYNYNGMKIEVSCTPCRWWMVLERWKRTHDRISHPAHSSALEYYFSREIKTVENAKARGGCRNSFVRRVLKIPRITERAVPVYPAKVIPTAFVSPRGRHSTVAYQKNLAGTRRKMHFASTLRDKYSK